MPCIPIGDSRYLSDLRQQTKLTVVTEKLLEEFVCSSQEQRFLFLGQRGEASEQDDLIGVVCLKDQFGITVSQG